MKYSCRSPILRVYDGKEYHVPCNQCVTCIIGRKAVWTGRTISEWESADRNGAFVTLTYSDDHIRYASAEDLEPYFEWFRDVYDMRYIIVPDTGDRFDRFHWHMCMFGPQLTPQFETDLREQWECGFVDVRPVIRERIGYLCGYTTKKLSGITTGRVRCSPFWGKAYLVDKARELADSGTALRGPPRYITFDGRRYPLGPLQREWFVEAHGNCPSLPGARIASNFDHLEKAFNAVSLSGTIADEKQATNTKGTTIGAQSATERRLNGK